MDNDYTNTREFIKELAVLTDALLYRDLDASFRALLDTGIKLMEQIPSDESKNGHKTFTVHKVERNTVKWVFTAGSFNNQRADYGVPKPIDKGLVGKAISLKEPFYYAPDVSKEPEYDPVNKKTKSEFICPIFDVSGNILGILNAESDQIDDFNNPLYEDLLPLIAKLAVVSFKYEQTQALENSFVHALKLSIDNPVVTSSALTAIIVQILSCVTHESGFDTAALFLSNESTDTFRSFAFYSHDQNFRNLIDNSASEFELNSDSLVGWVLKNGSQNKELGKTNEELIGFSGATSEKSLSDSEQPTFSYGVPIRFSLGTHRVDGCILLVSKELLPIDISRYRRYWELLEKAVLRYNQSLENLSKTNISNLINTIYVASDNEPDDLSFIDQVASKVQRLIGLEGCTVYLYSEADDLLYPIGYAGYAQKESILKITYGAREGIIGESFDEKKPIWVKNLVEHNKSKKKAMNLYELYGVKNAALYAIPMIYSDIDNVKPRGVLSGIKDIRKTPTDPFHLKSMPIESIQDLGSVIGSILANRESKKIDQIMYESFEFLADAVKEISHCKTKDDLWSLLHKIIKDLVQDQFFCIFIYDESHNVLRSAEDSLKLLSQQNGLEFSPGDGHTGKSATEGYAWHPRVDHAPGRTECVQYWDKIVGSSKRFFYGRAIYGTPHLKKDLLGVITINGARKDESFASFTENVFFGIIDRRMKFICNEVSNVVAGFK